ncbi:CoA pyrophosphatase [Labilibaculum sp.]|uniref:NUDIX hydrolase n=1 Tax=Labilibaculum sp. TaxID=2060723 RepID=UPI00356251B0
MSISKEITKLEPFIRILNDELNIGLPGFEAQKLMSPSSREQALLKSDPSKARDSSVLLLFYPKEGQLHLPFIKRTTGNTNHSGQMSFPGGKYEESDANRTITAIRETNEELGVECEKINILGFLTELYIPVSNFMVLPVLAYSDERPSFTLSEFEVEELIEMPLTELLQKDNISEFIINKNGHRIAAPFFHAKGHKIWGATAMILSELREILLRAALI